MHLRCFHRYVATRAATTAWQQSHRGDWSATRSVAARRTLSSPAEPADADDGDSNVSSKLTEVLQHMAIGGLEEQIRHILRRAFLSRRLSPEVVQALGLRHTKVS